MRDILIGTASWTDKSLIASGRFYPAKCNSPEERLRYYASQFPLVEVDSSYYAMPKPEVAQLWAERTPQDFTFNIKAFRLFTGHQTSSAALPKDVAEALGPIEKRNLYYKDLPRELTHEMWRQYREAIEPLKRSGKLAAVHFQFAPWVAYHPKSRAHIEKGLTSSAQRFNYDYNDDELEELGKKIEAITAASVHVVLNNNYEDQGQRNARTLMRFVGRSRVTKAR
jgi:uncharacterized protein YecE (DUF72 family)